MPATLASSYLDNPIWVDARKVLTKDGQVDQSLFNPGSLAAVEGILAAPERNGCAHLEATFVDSADQEQRRDSLESAAGSAKLILLGRVISRAYGFSDGIPGQLLRVQSERVITGPPGVWTLCAFFPGGAGVGGGLVA